MTKLQHGLPIEIDMLIRLGWLDSERIEQFLICKS